MNKDKVMGLDVELNLKTEESQVIIQVICSPDQKPRIRKENISRIIDVSGAQFICGYNAVAACLKEYRIREAGGGQEEQKEIDAITGINVRKAMWATWKQHKSKYQLCFSQEDMDRVEHSMTHSGDLPNEYWFDSVVAAQVAADTIDRVVMVIGDEGTTTTYPLFKRYVNPHKVYPVIMYLRGAHYLAITLIDPIRAATDEVNAAIILSRARDVAPHADSGALMAVYLEMYTPDLDEEN